MSAENSPALRTWNSVSSSPMSAANFGTSRSTYPGVQTVSHQPAASSPANSHGATSTVHFRMDLPRDFAMHYPYKPRSPIGKG
jgi:hypothetical protein